MISAALERALGAPSSRARVRAGTVPILIAATLAAAGCGSDQVTREASQPGARGDAKDSLFRAANLRRALAVVRRRFGQNAALASFRLEAGALKAEVQVGAGTSVVVSKDLRLTSVPTPGVPPAPPLVTLGQIDPGAPARIMSQVAPRAGVGLRGVDYFLIAAVPGSPLAGWELYLRDGKGSFAADLNGANAKPFGASAGATGATTTTPVPTAITPPAPTGPATTTPVPAPAPTPTNPATTPSKATVQRQLDCIRRANNDAARVRACLRQ